MIRLTDNLWIGNATTKVDIIHAVDIGAILNVAQDLHGVTGWPEVEYMQVGLIDGPGNPTSAYYAAILALVTLLNRYNQVMMFCHGGSRSTAIAVMHANLTSGLGFDRCLSMTQERVDIDLPTPHQAHKDAFDMIDWTLLRRLM